jgi:hypothetical protein
MPGSNGSADRGRELGGLTMFVRIGLLTATSSAYSIRRARIRIGKALADVRSMNGFAAVRELTRSLDINLNARVSLRRHRHRFKWPHRLTA